MIVRALPAVVGLALIVAGCGGSSAPSPSVTVHLDGKSAQGDYVFETDGSGAQFLVPASVVSGQGSRAFDVAKPPDAMAGEPNSAVTIAPPPYGAVVASATAVVPHSAHVEVLATGDPGRRFALSWEESAVGRSRDTPRLAGPGDRGWRSCAAPRWRS